MTLDCPIVASLLAPKARLEGFRVIPEVLGKRTTRESETRAII
jgi:hypothetical protein